MEREQAAPLSESEEAYARAQWLDPTDLRLFATIDAERARRVAAETALAEWGARLERAERRRETRELVRYNEGHYRGLAEGQQAGAKIAADAITRETPTIIIQGDTDAALLAGVKAGIAAAADLMRTTAPILKEKGGVNEYCAAAIEGAETGIRALDAESIAREAGKP